MVQPEERRDPIPLISEKDYWDYEFIGKDLQDFAAQSPQEQIKVLFADPWRAISGFKGAQGFDIPLSPEAKKRFIQIASRGLKHLGPRKHIHRLERVVEALKAECSLLVLGGLEITVENAHEVFDSALRKLEEGYLELTYYVPCSVVAERSYPCFNIGPVCFVLRDNFFSANEASIQNAVAEFGTPQINEKVFADLRSFYSGFQWVASITVPRCDPETSRRRAHDGIQKALDVFKLVVGSQRASHVKQAYDLTIPSDYSELISSSPGSFSLRFGGKLQDAITNDRWYEQMTASPAWPFLESVLSNYWNTWRGLDEIQTRFLDGLSWHSDAISEQDRGARIVKFWTSIERLLSISPGSNISARAAVLASDGPEDFGRQAKELELLYQRRSAIVHGGASRASESWYAEASHASEGASRIVLFQYLYDIPQIHALRQPTDRKKLGLWLRELDSTARQYRRSAK